MFHLPFLYVGPGIGVGTIIIVLLVLGLVLFSFGVILWMSIKRIGGRRIQTDLERKRKPWWLSSIFFLAKVLMILSALSIFSWTVLDATSGDRSLGQMSKLIDKLAHAPGKVVAVLKSGALQNIPDHYVEPPPSFVHTNRLSSDQYGLSAFWDEAGDAWRLHLFNFRDNTIWHTWNLKKKHSAVDWQLDQVGRLFENSPPIHPLLLEDGSLITKLEMTPNLIRVDSASRVLWSNHELIFHHSLQLAPNGTVWTCAMNIPFYEGTASVGRVVNTIHGTNVPFQDDYVVNIDPATGDIIFKKGVAEILIENGMQGRLFGGNLDDPIHLNDINPVQKDGPYLRKGDLLLSLRNRSMVLQYDPSTNKVIRVIEGPLIQQHDVNILSESKLTIFNNRNIFSYQLTENNKAHVPARASIPVDNLTHSQVIEYDLSDSTFRPLFDSTLKASRVYTSTQGLHEILNDGSMFVEVQNRGNYLIVDSSGVVMNKAFASQVPGRIHWPTWARVFSSLPIPFSRLGTPIGEIEEHVEPVQLNSQIIDAQQEAVQQKLTVDPIVLWLAMLIGSIILALGIMKLKRPFILLAERTAKLVDALLDHDSDEIIKQKRLIAAAILETKSLLWLLCLALLVVIIASIPVMLLLGAHIQEVGGLNLFSGTNMLAILIGTTVPFLVMKRSTKADYSDWSKLLHRMVLDNFNIGRSLFRIARKSSNKKNSAQGQGDKGPVIVTGLARAGTTALTTMLAKSDQYYSLSYANMPFLLAPNLWRRFYKPKVVNARERSHGDKVLFSYNSVEALEEYFFKVFLKNGYIDDDQLHEHRVDGETVQAYLDYHRMVFKAGPGGTHYLAKNNNFALRSLSLSKQMPELRVVILFRNPLEHAHSLMKQHIRFTQLQEEDPFVLEYMNWLGHHEFGNGLKHFHFTGAEQMERSLSPIELDHWLQVWISYYTRILEIIEDQDALLIDYSDLLKEPNKVIDRIDRYVGIKSRLEHLEHFEKDQVPVEGGDPDLVARARGIYEQLVRQVKRMKVGPAA